MEFIIFTCAYCAAEAIDQWFENLQNYEATLEEMAAASLDVNFKEELSAIEQCESMDIVPHVLIAQGSVC